MQKYCLSIYLSIYLSITLFTQKCVKTKLARINGEKERLKYNTKLLLSSFFYAKTLMSVLLFKRCSSQVEMDPSATPTRKEQLSHLLGRKNQIWIWAAQLLILQNATLLEALCWYIRLSVHLHIKNAFHEKHEFNLIQVNLSEFK